MKLPDYTRLTIRRAKLEEKGPILEIFIRVTDWMMSNNIRQWDYTYPNEETITRDIEDNCKWIALWDDQQLAGTITINQKFDVQYEQISWDSSNPVESIWAIHRLAVLPEYFGNGVGIKLCLFAEKHVKEQGGSAIRLDAYSKNRISNNLYKKLGYTIKAGKLFFHKNEIPFNAYEKLLLR